MHRRLFVRTMGIAAGGIFVPKYERWFQPLVVAPLLWGDGIHDDTKALQALFDGKPVRFQGRTISETQDWEVRDRAFRVSSTLYSRETGQRRAGLFTQNFVVPFNWTPSAARPIFRGV